MTTLEERPPVLRKTRKTINVIIWVALCVMIAGVGVFALFVRFGHMRVVPILSGSMEPKLMTGDVAITRMTPVSAIKIGDIVVFHPPGAKATDPPKVHRVMTLKPLGKNKIQFTTKGDNNNVADPWGVSTMSGTAPRVVYDIPKIGWILNVKGQWIAIAALMLLAGYLTRWSVKYLRSPDTERTTPDQTGQGPVREETP